MATLKLIRNELFSRVSRQLVGQRSINPGKILKERNDDSGGFLGFVGSALTGLGGFLVSAISFLGFSFGALWSWVTSTTAFIFNFNWNISDEEITRQINNLWSRSAFYIGGTLGNAAGWLACGILPSMAMMSVNPALGRFLLKEVGEEALDELASNIAFTVRGLTQIAVTSGAYYLFKHARKAYKWGANLFNDLINGADAPDVLQGWGETGSEPFTFNQAIEERIEQIPNQYIQNLVEEFYEELIDSCVEAGYAVALNADSFYSAQNESNQGILGTETVVEIKPNRDNDNERLILAGGTQTLKPAIHQALNNYGLVRNRDIGQWVGQPISESSRAKPFRNRLIIQMCAVPFPPFGRARVVTITVPDADRTRIDWDRIRQAVGGANGYTWGRFCATAFLSNGRQMQVYGATEAAAVTRVKALIELSDAELLTLSVSEQQREGAALLNPRLFKEATQVYPRSLTVEARQFTFNQDQGTPSTAGNYVGREYTFPLYEQQKPADFEARINELFTQAGIQAPIIP